VCWRVGGGRSVAERPGGGGRRYAVAHLSHPADVHGPIQRVVGLFRPQQRALLLAAAVVVVVVVVAARDRRRPTHGPVALRRHDARQQRTLSLRAARPQGTVARPAVRHRRQ